MNNGFTRKKILVVHQEQLPNSKAHSIMGQTIQGSYGLSLTEELKSEAEYLSCVSTLAGINVLQGPFYAMILGNTKILSMNLFSIGRGNAME